MTGRRLDGRTIQSGHPEPVDGAHELHLKFCGQEAFKPLLDFGIFGEVDEVVNVETQMKGFVGRSCGRHKG